MNKPSKFANKNRGNMLDYPARLLSVVIDARSLSVKNAKLDGVRTFSRTKDFCVTIAKRGTVMTILVSVRVSIVEIAKILFARNVPILMSRNVQSVTIPFVLPASMKIWLYI